MNFSTHQLPEVLSRRITALGWKETTSAQDQILTSIACGESFFIEAHRGSGKRSAALLGVAARLCAGGTDGPLDPERPPRALIITETDEEAVALCARFEVLTAGTHLSALVLGEGGDIARAQRSIFGVDLILGRANFIGWAADRFKLSFEGVETVGVFSAKEVFDTEMGLPRLEKVLKRLPQAAVERMFFLSDEILKRCEIYAKSCFPRLKLIRTHGRYGASRLLERFDLIRPKSRTATVCERVAQLPRDVRVIVLTTSQDVSKISRALNAAGVPVVIARKRHCAEIVEQNMRAMGASCVVADIEHAPKTFPKGTFDAVIFNVIPEEAGEYEEAVALAWFAPTKRRPWCGFALMLCAEEQYKAWRYLRGQLHPNAWKLLDCTGGQNEVGSTLFETPESLEYRCARTLNHARGQVGMSPLPVRGMRKFAGGADEPAEAGGSAPEASSKKKGAPVKLTSPWTLLQEAGVARSAAAAGESAGPDAPGEGDEDAEAPVEVVIELTDFVWEAELTDEGRVVEVGTAPAACAPDSGTVEPAAPAQNQQAEPLLEKADGLSAPAAVSEAPEPQEPSAAAVPAPSVADLGAPAPKKTQDGSCPPEAQLEARPAAAPAQEAPEAAPEEPAGDETAGTSVEAASAGTSAEIPAEAPHAAPVEDALEEAGREADEEVGREAGEEAAAGSRENDAGEAAGACVENAREAHEDEEAFGDDGAECEDEDELPEDEAFDDEDDEWDDAGEDEAFEEDDFEDDGEYAGDEEAYGHEFAHDHDEEVGESDDDAPHRRTLTIRSGYVPREDKDKDEPVVMITEPLSSNTVELRAAQERMRREMKGGERLTHQMVGRRGTLRRPKRRAADAMPAEQEGILAAQPMGRRSEKDGERRRQKKAFQRGAKPKQRQKQQHAREKDLQPAFLAESYSTEALTVPGEGSRPAVEEERRPKSAQKPGRKQRNAQKKAGSLRTPFNKRRKQRQDGAETSAQTQAAAPAPSAAPAPAEAPRASEALPQAQSPAPQTSGEAASGAQSRPAGGKLKRRRDQQTQQGQQKGRRHRDKERRANKTDGAQAPFERGYGDEGGAEDNFGNSIHYRPKRAAAAAMPWQTADAYAADRPQTLSFAQTMPGESGFEAPRTIFGSSQPDNKAKPSGGRKFQKFRKPGGRGVNDRGDGPRGRNGRAKSMKKPRGE